MCVRSSLSSFTVYASIIFLIKHESWEHNNWPWQLICSWGFDLDLGVNCRSQRSKLFFGFIVHLKTLFITMHLDDMFDHQISWDMLPFMRETLLHTALALKRDDVIQYLVSEGANVNIEDCKGQTIMQCADEGTRRHIMQELQSRSGLQASL